MNLRVGLFWSLGLTMMWPSSAFALDCGVAISKALSHVVRSAAELDAKLQGDFFRSQKDPPYLARGLLVELSSGKKVFTISDYLGSEHKIMLSDVENQTMPATVSRVLWVGEVGFEKKVDGFVVALANHTSGMWFDTTKVIPKPLPLVTPATDIKNDGAALVEFFAANHVPTKPGFVVEPYSQARPHLLAVEVKANDSLLHQFRNIVNQVNAALFFIIDREQHSEDEIREVVGDFREEIPKNLLPVYTHMQTMYPSADSSAFATDVALGLELIKDFDLINNTPVGESNPAFEAALARFRDPKISRPRRTALTRVATAVQSIEAATSGKNSIVNAAGEAEPVMLPKVVHMIAGS